ncbi:hypothetical protein WN48_10247 [Eufriesea mexicana]|uniref:Uncharacterized protein n=1 Tax=Eufriesea mexicana TaxID=516756 RepID=A0A310SGQ4_9HYME|nr:hypothetical protein WN48_10247 [Eufriesea mexicana]
MAVRMYKEPGTICLDYLNGLLDTTTSSSSRWKDGAGPNFDAELRAFFELHSESCEINRLKGLTRSRLTLEMEEQKIQQPKVTCCDTSMVISISSHRNRDERDKTLKETKGIRKSDWGTLHVGIE